MDSTGREFRAWVLAQRVGGTEPVQINEDSIRIDIGPAVAEVNLYPYQDGLEIAEYQIVRATDGEAIFYLHVLLDDLNRAKELFFEMAEALQDETSHTTTHVLLCCTSATTMPRQMAWMVPAGMNTVSPALTFTRRRTSGSVLSAMRRASSSREISREKPQ